MHADLTWQDYGGDMHDGELSEEMKRLLAVTDRLRAWRVELTGQQLAALQTLDTAFRAGKITAEDVAEIESVIRQGHVHGARKRITAAKRRGINGAGG